MRTLVVGYTSEYNNAFFVGHPGFYIICLMNWSLRSFVWCMTFCYLKWHIALLSLENYRDSPYSLAQDLLFLFKDFFKAVL